jgi:hypothetical protein
MPGRFSGDHAWPVLGVHRGPEKTYRLKFDVCAPGGCNFAKTYDGNAHCDPASEADMWLLWAKLQPAELMHSPIVRRRRRRSTSGFEIGVAVVVCCICAGGIVVAIRNLSRRLSPN